MMISRLIGAAALSLMLATPAMAMQHRHHRNYSKSTVENALQHRYGSSYARGLYPQEEFFPNYYDGQSLPSGYDPVPPSANGG